jgi:hypothetical protein
VTFEKHIDPHRLRAAVHDLVSQTSILRTRFVVDPRLGILQVVLHPSSADTLVPPVFLAETGSSAGVLARGIIDGPFGDPQKSPMHAQIIASEDGPVLAWILHHAIVDQWSFNLMTKKVERLYNEQGLGVTGPPFASVARYVAQRDPEADRKFWKTYLEGAQPSQLMLQSAMYSRSYTNDRATVDSATLVDVSATARSLGIAPSTIYLYAVAVALQLFTEQDDVSFGLLLAGRTLPIRGVEDILGPCLLATICRIKLDQSASVADALTRLQAELNMINERAQFGLVESGRAGSVDASTIASIMCEYRNLESGASVDTLPKEESLSSLSFGRAVTIADDRVVPPLMLSAEPVGAGLKVTAMTDTTVFPAEEARWLVQHICGTIAWICQSGSDVSLRRLNIVDDAQRIQLLQMASVEESQLDGYGTFLLQLLSFY